MENVWLLAAHCVRLALVATLLAIWSRMATALGPLAQAAQEAGTLLADTEPKGKGSRA